MRGTEGLSGVGRGCYAVAATQAHPPPPVYPMRKEAETEKLHVTDNVSSMSCQAKEKSVIFMDDSS